MKSLPSKKAVGPDKVSNKLIKTALPAIGKLLTHFFNTCFKAGNFPRPWCSATTAIIRKSGKDCYAEHNEYRPIALLSCLGKVFEKILTRRLNYWAESSAAISPCHMGGRRQHNVDDAATILPTWVKAKWREGKSVGGLFLDVKSSYPSVHNIRLLHKIHNMGCPLYITRLVEGFLTHRTTRLRLQDFLSDNFSIENGLHQGSPLSVTLYILYNSSLLIPQEISLQADEISLAFIDDVAHLAAYSEAEGLS